MNFGEIANRPRWIGLLTRPMGEHFALAKSGKHDAFTEYQGIAEIKDKQVTASGCVDRQSFVSRPEPHAFASMGFCFFRCSLEQRAVSR